MAQRWRGADSAASVIGCSIYDLYSSAMCLGMMEPRACLSPLHFIPLYWLNLLRQDCTRSNDTPGLWRQASRDPEAEFPVFCSFVVHRSLLCCFCAKTHEFYLMKVWGLKHCSYSDWQSVWSFDSMLLLLRLSAVQELCSSHSALMNLWQWALKCWLADWVVLRIYFVSQTFVHQLHTPPAQHWMEDRQLTAENEESI